jgi:hypothetical protein
MKDNPTLVIQKLHLPDGRNFHLIQDGVLLAGTKQRVVVEFLKKIIKENPKIETILYAGVWNGFGGIAIAYSAKKLGKACNIYLTKEGKDEKEIFSSKQYKTLKSLKANIYLYNTYREAREAEYNISTIEINKNKWKTLPEYYIAPMGLHNDEGKMTNMLSKKIIKASKNTILEEYKNPRIWLVAGSGGIAEAIYKAFPNATLFLLLTGGGKYKKRVCDWAKEKENIILIQEEKDIKKKDNRSLYYSSVKDYDDLIWPYVKKYGSNLDFIWNIASDENIV